MTMDRGQLLTLINGIRDTRVLCLGDVMLDRFVYGSVDRISPEAPIPVLRIRREAVMPGGAGNVARNLAALGAKVHLVAAVGDDEAGRQLMDEMSKTPGISHSLVAAAGRPTTVKTRFIAGSQQMLRADRETTEPIDWETRHRVLNAAGMALAECDALILSDYGKGVVCPEITTHLIAAARKAGKPVVVDPKGTDYSRYAGATVLTPNRKELAEATRMPVGSDDDITEAARRLMDDFDTMAVVVTRSQDGMTVVTFEGGVTHLKAEAREVFDVSGAGDTVAAVLAATTGSNADIVNAAMLANVAAGIVVGKVGTAVVYAAELLNTLLKREIPGPKSKILSLDQALNHVAAWRAQGFRIGFTNGCFDLLHPGHVSLFNQARAACDRLVVGVNTDASVQRLKGPERPVQNEAARMTVLAALEPVDLVVPFGEDTPIRLIEAILPDVLVKGKDYKRDEVVGAGVVEGHGGRVILADLEPGHSTTATLARINGNG